MKYDAPVSRRRKLWMSEAFVAKHAPIAQIIRDSVRLPKSKVRLLKDLEEFQAAKEKALRSKRPRDVLGIVTSKEKKHIIGADTAEEALAFLSAHDLSQSRVGVSGM